MLKPILTSLFFSLFFLPSTYSAINNSTDNFSLFPIENYNQAITTWLNPTDPNYNQPVISASQQQARLQEFYQHYYSTSSESSSPWSQTYVTLILQQSAPNDIKTIEQSLISSFDNQGKDPDHIGYGQNLRPHTEDWIGNIAKNMQIDQFNSQTYEVNRRGIAISNLLARILPTQDPHFYNAQIAGQGYPFDNLQMSAIWIGTPLYILGESSDKTWDLVLTPSFIGWVKANGVALVNENFVTQWQNAAQQELTAIIKNNTPLIDQNGLLQETAYIGTVLPSNSISTTQIKLWIPIKDNQQQAVITTALVSTGQATQMPFTATPSNFALLIKQLIGRPYAWGGMNFYNDCSQETQSLFTPFAIWLPRHSSYQVNQGRLVDLSAQNMDQRLNYLLENGHPLTTLIYIGGHVVLYIGKYPNPEDPNEGIMAMTYQNMWGLTPPDNSRRAVVGESVFFPMLKQYPEDPSLVSLANKKFFQLGFLNEMPAQLQAQRMDLRELILPESNMQ